MRYVVAYVVNTCSIHLIDPIQFSNHPFRLLGLIVIANEELGDPVLFEAPLALQQRFHHYLLRWVLDVENLVLILG